MWSEFIVRNLKTSYFRGNCSASTNRLVKRALQFIRKNDYLTNYLKVVDTEMMVCFCGWSIDCWIIIFSSFDLLFYWTMVWENSQTNFLLTNIVTSFNLLFVALMDMVTKLIIKVNPQIQGGKMIFFSTLFFLYYRATFNWCWVFWKCF